MAEFEDSTGTRAMSKAGIAQRIAFRSVPSFEELPTEETPENFMMEHFSRSRAMSHHLSSTDIPSRKSLIARARWWRALMTLGMRFHGWAFPRPPKPDFVRTIETDTMPIELFFYVPKNYRVNYKKERGHTYPMVVNFHGGGFTLGHATDDRYFARVIQQHTNAVFISVNYRRAPEHPFPAAVDDSVEALMYLSTHATELRLDPTKTALTGFSAGGNLSFTVPFRLTYYTNPNRPRLYPGPGSATHSRDVTPNISRVPTRTSIEAGMNPEVTESDHLNPRAASSSVFLLPQPISNHDGPGSSASNSRDPSPLRHEQTASEAENEIEQENGVAHVHFPSSQLDPPHHLQQEQEREQAKSSRPSNPARPKPVTRKSSLNPDRPSNLRILSIVAWYPLLDWTSSRSAKVRSSRKPSATLKKTFTDLFDHSYLPPPDDARSHLSPFASPGLAPEEMIKEGLPTKIQLWLCEYDMLLAEGEEFAKRLTKHGKEVYGETIDKVPHGWDKSPNPFRNQKKIDELYKRSAKELQAVFDSADERPGELRGERIALGGLR